MNKNTKRKKSELAPSGKNPMPLDMLPKVGASAPAIMKRLWGPGGRKQGAM